MIYTCCCGEVIKVHSDSIELKTYPDHEVITAYLQGDLIFDMEEGDEGVFIGYCINGKYSFDRVELRKFLDPLYQQDLLEESSLFEVINVVDDPFPEIFRNYLQYEEHKPTTEESSVQSSDTVSEKRQSETTKK